MEAGALERGSLAGWRKVGDPPDAALLRGNLGSRNAAGAVDCAKNLNNRHYVANRSCPEMQGQDQ